MERGILLVIYHIKLFAGLADLCGKHEVELPLSNDPVRAELLMNELAVRFPAADKLLRQCFMAVNMEYVALDKLVSSKDEIALIPPVSGG
jgi:molybdopterin converting factor subunit 1